MAKSQTWVQAQNKDTSIFKTIHAMLLACGVVQTADTGQLDMTVAPVYSTTAANNYGYTIYQFNDAAQATYPLFFRIDWKNGRTTASPINMEFFITVGSGSNGSGTISGNPASSSVTCSSGQAAGSVSNTTYFSALVSGDGSSIACAINLESGGAHGQFFCIERFRDSSGVAKTNGFWFAAGLGTNASTSNVWSTYGGLSGSIGAGTSSTRIPVMDPWPWTDTAQANSGNIPFFPVMWLSPAVEHSMILGGVPQKDMPHLTIFNVTHLGGTHTYIAISYMSGASPSTFNGVPIGPALVGSVSGAMLWE